MNKTVHIFRKQDFGLFQAMIIICYGVASTSKIGLIRLLET